MFSFRTTPIEEQLDKALLEGSVACFCTQNCWHADSGRYLYDIFRERGNLKTIFSPRDAELTPLTNHIEFDVAQLAGLNAVVVEIQDVGARYFNYTKDVFRLMAALKDMETPPSLYVVDHINPAGRVVEGSMTGTGRAEGNAPSEPYTPKIPHRHGLTLGELALLYYNELGARYPLHVISALATESGRQLLPWAIAPASDIPGLFTCDLYSGGGLWNGTNVSPGIGTARPYEYIGAPFINPELGEVPTAAGIMMRPCTFTPSCGIYQGQRCHGWQIMLEPGMEYHSLLHTVQIIRFLRERYTGFQLLEGFMAKLSDDFIYDYIVEKVTFDELREHVKLEEQKWIRKAKKFLLYDDQPYRCK